MEFSIEFSRMTFPIYSGTKNHSEDHLLLGGFSDFELIDARVKKENTLDPLPDPLKEKYEVPPELKNVLSC